ncbi:hypothetical protein JCM10213_003684 [Rhodosporidiobolus nylandii]
MPRKKSVGAPAPEIDDDGGLEAFELQKSVVARLCRAAVPEEVKLQKEVPIGLQKASTVFISYLAALAHDTATERNHKTINATHVLDAAKQLAWDDGDEFSRVLKKELSAFRANNDARKQGLPAPYPPWQTGKGKAKAKDAPAASTSSAAAAKTEPDTGADGEAAEAAAGAEGQPEDGATVLPDDRPNADEEGFPEPAEDEDNGEFEEYVDEEGEDEEMDDAGSEGVEDEVADRGLEDDAA